MPIKIFDGGLDPNTTKPVYIGVDQSYSGFSITMLAEDKYYTVVRSSDYRGVERLSDIRMFLHDFIAYLEVEDAAMEGYAFGSQMANMLGELGGMVKLEFFSSTYGTSKYPLIIPPTTLKKYVTGKGQGVPKSQMVLHVYKKWGVEFSDDNAADSYALARLASGYSKLAYEKEICEKVKDPKFRER